MALEDIEVQHFFVGGGAEHSAEQVRRFAYGVQQGAEGICELDDLQVLPLTFAGAGVRVTIGSAFIRSANAGAVREMYFGSVTREQTVPIPENTGSGVRRDLIIMRVRDPYVQGSPWTDPGEGMDDDKEAQAAARAGAQYVFIERIGSVPAGTRRLQDVPGYEYDTAYTLARVEVPVSAPILLEHIIPLSVVHTPRTDSVKFSRPRIASDDDPRQMELKTSAASGGEVFPGGAGIPNSFDADMPVWAKRVSIDGRWLAVFYGGGYDPRGHCWIEFGLAGSGVYPYATQRFGFNATASADHRSDSWSVADILNVPPELRGKRVRYRFMAGRTDTIGTGPKAVWMQASGGLTCDLRYSESSLDTYVI